MFVLFMLRVLPVSLGEGLWVSDKRVRQNIGVPQQCRVLLTIVNRCWSQGYMLPSSGRKCLWLVGLVFDIGSCYGTLSILRLILRPQPPRAGITDRNLARLLWWMEWKEGMALLCTEVLSSCGIRKFKLQNLGCAFSEAVHQGRDTLAG